VEIPEELVDVLGPEAAVPLAPRDRTDEELVRDAAEAEAQATERQITYAMEFACGASAIQAARKAGMSVKYASPWRTRERPVVARLIAIYREQARRKSSLTVEGQIARFQNLARMAEENGEYATAVSAEREAARIAGLYPEMRMKLDVAVSTTSDVTPEEMEQLARLRHEVRRLPPAVDVTPLPTGSSYASAANAPEVSPGCVSRHPAPAVTGLDSSLDSIEAPDAA
jgi:hypothetical protein